MLSILYISFKINPYVSDLFAKVKPVPNICGIELAFTGSMQPSTIEGYQVFHNSFPSDTDFTEMYAGKVTLSFNEESEITNAGISWKQKISFRFPSSDGNRADRLEKMTKVKYIKIKLSNKLDLIMGRNDFGQNARPVVSVKSEEKLTQVEFTTSSISPIGYTPYLKEGGLPVYIPINLINED